jgi:hypothetical protein
MRLSKSGFVAPGWQFAGTFAFWMWGIPQSGETRIVNEMDMSNDTFANQRHRTPCRATCKAEAWVAPVPDLTSALRLHLAPLQLLDPVSLTAPGVCGFGRRS